MNPTHQVPTDDDLPLVESTFWKVSRVLVVIHSAFIWVFIVVSVAMLYEAALVGAKGYSFSYLIPLWIFLFTSSILAIIGFNKRRDNGKGNWPLVVYIVMQAVFAIWQSAPYIYMSTSGWQNDYQDLITNVLIGIGIFMVSYTVLSFPILLLAGRGLWVLIVKPPPPTDIEGRFLKCVSCDYDLRGTPGRTCPECGASVMSYPTWKR